MNPEIEAFVNNFLQGQARMQGNYAAQVQLSYPELVLLCNEVYRKGLQDASNRRSIVNPFTEEPKSRWEMMDYREKVK